VVVGTISECYEVLGHVHSLWKPIPGRFKDFIAMPKPNNYQSLHTTVVGPGGERIEIQIRTQEMHKEAEYGIASHLSYKELGKRASKEEVMKKTGWTKDLLEWQKDVAHHQEFLKNLKSDFFEKRVFVLTPKGDVIDLPEGSTPIDFAYAVHSDIGDHTSGVKVNGKLVPLETKLQNRDVVEIEVKETATPKRKWLDHAQTNLAKRHIKNYIKEHGGPIDKLLARKY
jgi:GTP pyrophosphokinase